jgi:hypothetical protein
MDEAKMKFARFAFGTMMGKMNPMPSEFWEVQILTSAFDRLKLTSGGSALYMNVL